MPPGLTIGFILSLLLVATMLPEEVKVTQEEGQRERERERGGGAASPQTYITTRGILSLSPTLAILSPPRCSFVDFSSDREKRKIVGRWKREREREKAEPVDSKIVEKREGRREERREWKKKTDYGKWRGMVGRSTYLLEWTKNGRLENGGTEGIDEFQSCPCNNRLELFGQGSNGRDCSKEYFSVNFTITKSWMEIIG